MQADPRVNSRERQGLPDLRGDGAVGGPVAGEYSGHVGDSGERRGAAQAAIDAAVPAEVLTKALCALRLRQDDTFVAKVLSVMRMGLGDHVKAPKSD